MHSGDLSELEKSDLSEQERETLIQVMQRAKQFDQQTQNPVMSGPLEGQLQKWTNPLKGWQPRWFCVDKQQGVLHYYTSEDKRKQPPRGSLHLWGAVVSPSEEDSQSFSISGTNSEVYKLRAVDAKQRQYWVSRLRREVENLTNQFSSMAISPTTSPNTTPSKSHPNGSVGGDHHHLSVAPSSSSPPTSHSRVLSKRLHALSFSKLKHAHAKTSEAAGSSSGHGKGVAGGVVGSVTSVQSDVDSSSPLHSVVDLEREEFPGGDAMLEVLTRLQTYQESMQVQLESYGRQTGLDPFSKNVLLLKATSQAAVHSVRDCLALMKLQQQREQASQSEHQKQQQQQKGSGSSEVSPGRPRSMAGLDVQVNAAALDGESWRERSSSDGKILKKTAS